MKNKIASLLLLVFFVAAIVIFGGACDAAAQNRTDKILVAGNTPLKQSEVDKLIEFYEWAFQTQFTSDERMLYQSSVVQGFRQDATTARQNMDILIRAYAKVSTLSADEQNKRREMFNESFVKDLRAASDEASQMMLAVYERGAGKSNIVEVLPDDEDSKGEPKSSGGKGGAGSSKLVGAWFRSDGTGGARDPGGKTRYNSGTDTTFEFYADGRMQITIKKETLSITQCQINETTKLPGNYSVSGDELTMNLGTGSSVGTDSCRSSGNFKKTLTSSTMKQTFVVKNLESVFRPDAPLVLCLNNSSDDKCFEKLVK